MSNQCQGAEMGRPTAATIYHFSNICFFRRNLCLLHFLNKPSLCLSSHLSAKHEDKNLINKMKEALISDAFALL